VVDTKALLKGFGAAADVAGQIATDKAVNSRRQSKVATAADATAALAAQALAGRSDALRGEFNINDGQALAGIVLNDGSGEQDVPHDLGRIPFGAIVLQSNTSNVITCMSTDETYVRMKFNGVNTVNLWVF